MVAETPPWWEIIKALGIFASTTMLAWVVKTLREVSDGQTKLMHIVVGIDGTNGLRAASKDHEERLSAQEDRNIALDAVAELERAEYHGNERRHGPQRRIRDMIREEMERADKGAERRKP